MEVQSKDRVIHPSYWAARFRSARGRTNKLDFPGLIVGLRRLIVQDISEWTTHLAFGQGAIARNTIGKL